MIAITDLKKGNSLTILIVVLCICAFSLIINMGSYGAMETSDVRYAKISTEMSESGDFIHPILLSVKHYHKLPLAYNGG